MRVVILGAANSVHTVRWANGLASRGVEVHLVSCHSALGSLSHLVSYHRLSFRAPLGYVASVRELQRVLAKVQPDLLHVHYATGYGLLGRLCGFHPYMLSVWGSDVYEFPRKSRFHRWLLAGNLAAADVIGSTSQAMANEVRSVCAHAKIFVTPFGVDEDVFAPEAKHGKHSAVTIGTVKTLVHKYGVDTLIKAFAGALSSWNEGADGIRPEMRLLIVGGGEQRSELEELAAREGVRELTEFRGAVPHENVPACLNEMDVYVALSRMESFGVAILEASATSLPVIVSDADGPKEVTVAGVTGYVVPRNDFMAAAEAIKELVKDPEKRKMMGEAGRRLVCDKYTWDQSVQTMLDVYSETIAQ